MASAATGFGRCPVQDNLLVSTDWLQQRLDDSQLRVVDMRGHVIPASEPPPHYFNHRDAWSQSHIPGAVFVDWVHEITDPADPCHAPVAGPARYQDFARRIGISANTRVVAYDDADGMFAARLWWTLLYYGHRRVAVLDGGWDKWIAEGRPVTDAQPAVAPGDFVARPDEGIRRRGEPAAGRPGQCRARTGGRPLAGGVRLVRPAVRAALGTFPVRSTCRARRWSAHRAACYRQPNCARYSRSRAWKMTPRKS